MSTISETYKKIRERVTAFVRTEGLRGRVFRGGAWLGAGSFVEQLFRFGRNMLLTRLLAPEAFGTMAIVQSATALILMTVDVGARDALIQSPRGSEEGHARAAWWMAIARAISIYSLIFLFAPVISRFYGNSELSALARVAMLSVLFDGAISPRAYIAIKEMKFRKWALVNNGGGVLGVLITITLSFFMPGVWALAIGYCSENAARCILSYIVCPFRPGLPEMAPIRDLLRFSKGVFGLALFNLLFSRSDIFVLGKLYSAADLGLYSVAIFLVQTPTSFLINIMNQTLLPALSGVQNDNDRLNRILLKVTSVTLLLGLPVLVFVTFCGRSLLTIVYGQRYSVVIAAVAIAACSSLLNILNNQITMAFFAKGMPQLHRRSVATMAVVAVVLTYPLAKTMGLWGAQLACVVAMIVGYLIQIERIRHITGLKLSQYRKTFTIPFAISGATAAIWIASRYMGIFAPPMLNIGIGIGVCLAAYALAGAMVFRNVHQIV